MASRRQQLGKHPVSDVTPSLLTCSYADKHQAQRALSKNGARVGLTLMVGVVPCKEPMNRGNSGEEFNAFPYKQNLQPKPLAQPIKYDTTSIMSYFAEPSRWKHLHYMDHNHNLDGRDSWSMRLGFKSQCQLSIQVPFY